MLARKIDSRYEIAAAIDNIGDAALAEGDAILAVQLKWAARNILDSIGVWQAEDDAILEKKMARCRAMLPEPEFTAAVAEGRSLNIEQAIVSASKTPIHR